ncbi:MAG: MmcQ/YjbR family DNA-binding protein [Phascolarctobacterium sp.]|nr:MmcQ/YjbR family DNA-binding protein [Phascolarctobacterium sp.]
MTRDEVFAYCEDTYGTIPDYPWADDNAVLRHEGNQKWYGVVLYVRKDRLGLIGEEYIYVINVKCDPFLIDSMLHEKGFHRAYHMNKEKWITARLDGSAEDEKIKMLIDMSFELTVNKTRVRKKAR